MVMNYNLPFISLAIICLYGLSSWLVKIEKLTLLTQRRIWNMALGFFFLTTAVSGLLLVIQSSSGKFGKLPFNLLFWHVEAGIGFSVVAIFHTLWHMPYFMAMFKRK